MACRIGITTNTWEREMYWRAQHPDLRWEILHVCYSKREAQRLETLEAARLGCEAHPGGGGLEYDTWYVYRFSYLS